MATAKIDVKIGRVEFVGEGDEKWVAAQLDKILTWAQTVPAHLDDGNSDDDENNKSKKTCSVSAQVAHSGR